MAEILTKEAVGLLTAFLDINYRALVARRAVFPYRQIVLIFERLIENRQVSFSLYDGESGRSGGAAVIRMSAGEFERVPETLADPQWHVRLNRSYIESVVADSGNYVVHPELLDWEWMKSRAAFRDVRRPRLGYGGLRVHDLMTPVVVTVYLGDTVQNASALMRKLDIGALAVVNGGGTVVGMLTDRDIVLRACADGLDCGRTRVSEVMTAGVVSCPEDAAEGDAAWIMESLKIRRLIAVDRLEQPVGILSLGDVAVRSNDISITARLLAAVSSPEEAEF
ncbi:MAG: CBS domain-containing protein [Bryobacterales bacterium]|nr:CBS domain-containing protein [Bryobacterales bacterium]